MINNAGVSIFEPFEERKVESLDFVYKMTKVTTNPQNKNYLGFQKRKSQIQQNFPIQSNATELLFLQHFMKTLNSLAFTTKYFVLWTS